MIYLFHLFIVKKINTEFPFLGKILPIPYFFLLGDSIFLVLYRPTPKIETTMGHYPNVRYNMYKPYQFQHQMSYKIFVETCLSKLLVFEYKLITTVIFWIFFVIQGIKL